MEQPKIKEIEKAADDYTEAHDSRIELAKSEEEAKAALLELMRRNTLKTYVRGEYRITVESQEKVVVAFHKFFRRYFEGQ